MYMCKKEKEKSVMHEGALHIIMLRLTCFTLSQSEHFLLPLPPFRTLLGQKIHY